VPRGYGKKRYIEKVSTTLVPYRIFWHATGSTRKARKPIPLKKIMNRSLQMQWLSNSGTTRFHRLISRLCS